MADDDADRSLEFFSPTWTNDRAALSEDGRELLHAGNVHGNFWASATCAPHLGPDAELRETLSFACLWVPPEGLSESEGEGEGEAGDENTGSAPRTHRRAGKQERTRKNRRRRTGGGGAVVVGFVPIDAEDSHPKNDWRNPLECFRFKSRPGVCGGRFSSGSVYGISGQVDSPRIPYGTEIVATLAYDGASEPDGEVVGRFAVEVVGVDDDPVVFSPVPPGCVPVIGSVNGASVRVLSFSKGAQGGLTKAARKR
jgi:hypothetical protein